MMIITWMTWKELLRKRVLMLTLLMSVIFLIAFWFVAKTLGDQLDRTLGRLDPSSTQYLLEQYQAGVATLSLGFFFASFVLAFLSIFSSFSTIAGEAEQGVLQALLPRPLTRAGWYTGRWIGYVSMGILYAALLFGSILFITGVHATIPNDAGALIRAFLLFASVVPLLVSVSMLGSCFLSAVGNGVFMTMLYGAGWLGGMIDKVSSTYRLEELATKQLNTIVGLMSLVMPADSLQNRMLAELFSLREMDQIIQIGRFLGPFAMGQIPSNPFLMYAAGYTVIIFIGGMWLFQRKDL
ncbi:ABC transporter permease [Paenibacillus piri]|uniref:ABC transporter permease n=1 Tax=Paenibacillus piri TaxID=2547395 RepID=A0A4R5KY37_9BACL|nr:ABC transporter permease subunit [Paenibacillus piri]TDG00139.1 ABC transporter permease [Paenibacillus piri]